MKVNRLSKECVTIASITLVFSLFLIIVEADYSQLGFVAAVLLSILITLLITRRRVILIAPWLLAVYAGVALSIFFYVLLLLTLPFSRSGYLLYTIGMLGGESMVLYTVCELFDEISVDKAKKHRRQTQLKGVTVK